MDAMQFKKQAEEDPQLRAFLQDVAQDVGSRVSVEPPEGYPLAGVDFLFGVAAYALYRLVKDYLDTRALKQQAEVIKTLVEAGFKPELAQATVIALLSRIAKRTEDDPVFRKALNLIGEG